MLNTIIPYYDNLLTGLGYFEQFYGLAEQLSKDGKLFPATYNSKGNWEHIDYERNCCYHRLTGQYQLTRSDDEEMVGGRNPEIEVTYPMRLVWWLYRDTLEDNGYQVHRINNAIANILYTDYNKTLNSQLKASRVSSETIAAEADASTVWEDEFDEVAFKLPSKMMIGYVDYTVTITGPESCLLDNINYTPPAETPLNQFTLFVNYNSVTRYEQIVGVNDTINLNVYQ